MERVLAVPVIGVDAQVFVAVFDADARYTRHLVPTEELDQETEVGPEGISMSLFIATDMREFMDEGEDEDVVAVVHAGGIAETHIDVLFVAGV